MEELLELIDERGVVVPANTSGYLQFVGYAQLVEIATRTDSVIRLDHRPGHFLVAGRTARDSVAWWCGQAVGMALGKAHVTGPHRTLMQDPVFAIDQLVEIAIRALSPAVNDTITALTCIDWLSAGLSRVSGRMLEEGVYRDKYGRVRLIESDPSYARMVNRAFDKIRQSARGMPAVLIRMIDSINSIMQEASSTEQRRILARQAEMILLSSEESVPEPNDRADVRGTDTRARWSRPPSKALRTLPTGGGQYKLVPGVALRPRPLTNGIRGRLRGRGRSRSRERSGSAVRRGRPASGAAGGRRRGGTAPPAVARAPHGREDHLVGAGSPGVAGQEGQHVELLGGEIDGGAVEPGLVVDEVEVERTRPRSRSAALVRAGRPGRRRAVRMRASSSAMPKGLVT